MTTETTRVTEDLAISRRSDGTATVWFGAIQIDLTRTQALAASDILVGIRLPETTVDQ